MKTVYDFTVKDMQGNSVNLLLFSRLNESTIFTLNEVA